MEENVNGLGELIMGDTIRTIEINVEEYGRLLDIDTRLGILRRMINDEDKESNYGQISTKVLRQVLGMASYERSADV